MAEETPSVEARVDELSKPGNEAELAKVLDSEFSAASKAPADRKPAEDPQDPEPKNPAATDPKTDPADPAKSDPSNPSSKTGEDTTNKNSAKDILADRNKAREEAAVAQTNEQVLSKKLDDALALINKLVAGKNPEGGEPANADDPADDKPMTKKEAEAFVEALLNKKQADSTKAADAEKSISEEIQALEGDEDAPHAKENADLIKEAMLKHPTMTAYAVYCMLVGAGKIPAADDPTSNSNSKRTSTGNRSKANLTRSKRPEDMTQAEREQHLQNEFKSGGMQGIA